MSGMPKRHVAVRSAMATRLRLSCRGGEQRERRYALAGVDRRLGIETGTLRNPSFAVRLLHFFMRRRFSRFDASRRRFRQAFLRLRLALDAGRQMTPTVRVCFVSNFRDLGLSTFREICLQSMTSLGRTSHGAHACDGLSNGAAERPSRDARRCPAV